MQRDEIVAKSKTLTTWNSLALRLGWVVSTRVLSSSSEIRPGQPGGLLTPFPHPGWSQPEADSWFQQKVGRQDQGVQGCLHAQSRPGGENTQLGSSRGEPGPF